ncbi:hypothetical protein [Bradyrhizobium sp. dw_411]|uniref:hypothetical protein n=1 Tax=Bradyrhizobium sp. dw_411 TaxID=2720082 RepID=UPI001BCBB48D|nr:hypothetical protein [Bradyrhizobium sp. dw_411]
MLSKAEGEYSFVKSLTVLSLFGTLIGAYFQNLSAYENKVTAQAQADMAAATQTFTDASSALAAPLNLQRQLITSYHNAVTSGTDAQATGYETVNAQEIYKDYIKAYADLSQNYNLLARKAELYIDMASDLDRNPTADGTPLPEEIDMSLLNAYGFDCEQHMPSFNRQNSKIILTEPKTKKTLTVDWYSTKHHVLAIETCFEINHQAMTAVKQWASGSTVDPNEKTRFVQKTFDIFHTRDSNQVLRLNAFMSLAMFDIDKIRIKYRPNGFICGVPGVSSALSLFGKCAPVKTSGPLG